MSILNSHYQATAFGNYSMPLWYSVLTIRLEFALTITHACEFYLFLLLQTQSTFKALYVDAEHKTYYCVQLPSIKYQRVEWLLNQRTLEAFQDHYWYSGFNQTVVRKRGQYASPFTNFWNKDSTLTLPILLTHVLYGHCNKQVKIHFC